MRSLSTEQTQSAFRRYTHPYWVRPEQLEMVARNGKLGEVRELMRPRAC
jgi:hypothetical protein